jgi:prolipoprotein diacylglyceryltransferase
MLLDFIVWDINPRIFSINGWGPVWYGLLFASAFLIGQQILFYIYRKDGKPDSDVEIITIYAVIATIVGARLGHVLFYDWDVYSKNPIEILKIWKGGLASHGAIIPFLVAVWLYTRRKKDQSFLWVLDRIVITVAVGGALIRMGNLMNSEIYGKASDVPWAFVFALPEGMESHIEEIADEEVGKEKLKNVKVHKISDAISEKEVHGEKAKYIPIRYEFDFDKRKVDTLQAKAATETLIKSIWAYPSFAENIIIDENSLNPKFYVDGDHTVCEFQAYGKLRQPTQIYEALFCIFLFGVTFWLWNKKRNILPSGVILAVFLILLFSFRIAVEFLKKEQVEKEKDIIESIGLNIGQLLSIPAILLGVIILIIAFLNKNKKLNA